MAEKQMLRAGFNRVLRFISESNERQKRVLAIAASLLLLMWLFPPYGREVRGSYSVTTTTNYGFLFGLEWDETMLVGRLLTQWAAVVIIALLAYFIFRSAEKQ